jgi:hypothetical protein
MGLLASIAEDEAALKTLTGKDHDDGEENNSSNESAERDEDGGYQPDRRSARERIASRRSSRKSRASSQAESQAPQEDGRSARGALGDTSGSGEESSGNGSASSGNGGASQGDADGVLETAPKDDAGWAKYRREQRELKAKLKDAEAELAKARSAPATETKTIPEQKAEVAANVKKRTLEELGAEPDREKDLAGWLVWNAEKNNIITEELRAAQTTTETKSKDDQRASAIAGAAVQDIESYKSVQPDFAPAFDHMKAEYTKAVKLLKPGISQQAITNLVASEIYNLALQCMKDGSSLGEVLYDKSIEQFGYRPGQARTSQEVRQGTGSKPNLKVVSDNRKRSASSLEGGGRGGANRVTPEQAAEMSPGELLELPEEDAEYLRSLGF